MATPETPPNRVANLRRSQRVCLSVPIVVIKGASGKTQASEETRTLIVSAHGALLVLRLAVQTGELICRVIHLGPDQSGKREVGVEFERPAPRFWRIAFPPADWSPRSPDAKPPTQHVPEDERLKGKLLPSLSKPATSLWTKSKGVFAMADPSLALLAVIVLQVS